MTCETVASCVGERCKTATSDRGPDVTFQTHINKYAYTIKNKLFSIFSKM